MAFDQDSSEAGGGFVGRVGFLAAWSTADDLIVVFNERPRVPTELLVSGNGTFELTANGVLIGRFQVVSAAERAAREVIRHAGVKVAFELTHEGEPLNASFAPLWARSLARLSTAC